MCKQYSTGSFFYGKPTSGLTEEEYALQTGTNVIRDSENDQEDN